MTIGRLKAIIAGYCGRSVEDFIVNDEDLILNALNNARRNLELEQDWEYSRTQATVTVNRFTGYELTSGLKTIRDAGIVGVDGILRPIKVLDKDSLLQKTREEHPYGTDYQDDEVRFPSDRVFQNTVSRITGIYQVNQTIFLAPDLSTLVTGAETEVDVKLDYYAWQADYALDTDEDFFCKFGSAYLQWSAIVECNYLVKAFVPREEGNLTSPTDLMEQAKERLIAWNDYVLNTGRVPELR